MRYFLEVSYKGTNYSGFQTQRNANTIQAEIEKALLVLIKQPITLTGSSRTDAGVHALQNYFHFDNNNILHKGREKKKKLLYNLNAILPEDIVIKNLLFLSDNSHCRFDAVSREYKYYIYQQKNPFLNDRGYYFPYKLDLDAMKQAAELVKGHKNFITFSKKNTQVKSFECTIIESEWIIENNCTVYHVSGNRFLRGMVRALTATMLKVGRGKLSVNDFLEIISSKDSTKASFAAPAQGLFLISVKYPENYFNF
jgi:tRNA pseudouridine38-40 synthase